MPRYLLEAAVNQGRSPAVVDGVEGGNRRS
jgi:hypothetical protein